MSVERLQGVTVSETLAIAARAQALSRAGVEVFDLSVGEPDFPSPPSVKAAAKEAVDEDFTRYTEAAGIPELRVAVAEKLVRENGVAYAPEEVLISAGAKHALFNACMALLEPGDAALIPQPYWLSYPHMVRLAGAVPRYVPTRAEDRFLLRARTLEAHLTDRTRVLFLNNPGNPTGVTYPREVLEELAEVVVRRGLWVIADEIYEKLVYEGEFVCFASLGEEVRRRTVTVNGFSKAFAMTGWRLGYAAAPRELIRDMTSVQSHATSSVCSISQRAALAALRAPAAETAPMLAAFRRRREAMVRGLAAIPHVRCPHPDGAFYAFPDVSYYCARLGPGRGSAALAEYLLEEARVAVVPGAVFGAEGHVRLSYATKGTTIERALAAMAAAFRRLAGRRG